MILLNLLPITLLLDIEKKSNTNIINITGTLRTLTSHIIFPRESARCPQKNKKNLPRNARKRSFGTYFHGCVRTHPPVFLVRGGVIVIDDVYKIARAFACAHVEFSRNDLSAHFRELDVTGDKTCRRVANIVLHELYQSGFITLIQKYPYPKYRLYGKDQPHG